MSVSTGPASPASSTLDPALKARLDALIASDDVVLFMKGNREQPRCGFSAAVVDILDGLIPTYTTVDVLADAAIRDGVKVYSDWPTIPQLYVKGEFLGGADIAREMANNGELRAKLGLQAPKEVAVDVALSAAAAQALLGAKAGEPLEHKYLRISVSPQFKHGLCFGPALPGDGTASSQGIDIRVDAGAVGRAAGLRIDVESKNGQMMFRIDNPNEPARVKDMSVQELAAKLKSGEPLHLFDVRPQGERDIAKIEGARMLDDDAKAFLAALPKDALIAFHCHHGGRSARAAAQYVQQGYRRVYNVTGGVDAWAREIDTTIKTY